MELPNYPVHQHQIRKLIKSEDLWSGTQDRGLKKEVVGEMNETEASFYSGNCFVNLVNLIGYTKW